MTLIPGKFYRTREGKKYYFANFSADGMCAAFFNEHNSLVNMDRNGRFSVSSTHNYDIVGEWVEPKRRFYAMYRIDKHSNSLVVMDYIDEKQAREIIKSCNYEYICGKMVEIWPK